MKQNRKTWQIFDGKSFKFQCTVFTFGLRKFQLLLNSHTHTELLNINYVISYEFFRRQICQSTWNSSNKMERQTIRKWWIRTQTEAAMLKSRAKKNVVVKPPKMSIIKTRARWASIYKFLYILSWLVDCLLSSPPLLLVFCSHFSHSNRAHILIDTISLFSLSIYNRQL